MEYREEEAEVYQMQQVANVAIDCYRSGYNDATQFFHERLRAAKRSRESALREIALLTSLISDATRLLDIPESQDGLLIWRERLIEERARIANSMARLKQAASSVESCLINGAAADEVPF